FETEAIAAAVRHSETERACVRLQPAERCGEIELRRERPRRGRGDVDGTARVVLTEAGRGVDREDCFDRLARRELPPNDLGLMANAAEARDEQQLHTRVGGLCF